VRGLILHCVQSAATGGENQLLDHEIAYILLRDENPDHIRALSRDDAMIIPARRTTRASPAPPSRGRCSRSMRRASCTCATRRAPSASNGAATPRRRPPSPPWRASWPTTTPWTLRGRLEPGMGLVCNNVLHDRSGFTETPERRRLLYRARYHERVAETTVRAPI
jgi:hypothetical protein